MLLLVIVKVLIKQIGDQPDVVEKPGIINIGIEDQSDVMPESGLELGAKDLSAESCSQNDIVCARFQWVTLFKLQPQ